MDRAKLEAERDKLEKELRVMLDIGATGVKKSLMNLKRGFKANGKPRSKAESDAARKKLERLRELGQMLADIPDKEERFP